MSKKITVYWACLEPEWMRAKEPVPILNTFLNSIEEPFTKICPAIKNSLNNVFGLRSLYDYSFTIGTDYLESKQYNKEFFDRFVNVRSFKDRLFSFNQRFIFFTEEDSLLLTGNLFPYMENNQITKRCTLVPGSYDIGKWFRALEFAFIVKPEFDEFIMLQDDIYQYIEFNSESKIELKQFKMSDALFNLLRDSDRSREWRKPSYKLSYFYNTFKLKTHILKEIKENLL